MSASDRVEHATVVQIDQRGVLIRGPSGAGKTALALELLFRARLCGLKSALVADDCAFLSRRDEDGAVLARVPDSIAGRIELRGFGIAALDPSRWMPETRLALVVSLVTPAATERVANPERRTQLSGEMFPELALPEREPVQAALAVFGWLGLAGRVI